MRTSFRFAFLIALFICSSTRAIAQDTLILTNGTIISSKILEVGTEEVKYKRFDNIDGPVFITKRIEINLIKYKNGVTDVMNQPRPAVVVAPTDPNPPIEKRGMFYRQEGNRMNEREMHQVLKKINDPEINRHIEKAKFAKAMGYIGFIAIPTFAFALGYTGYALLYNADVSPSQQMDYTPAIGCGIVAAAALATSITFKISRKNHNNAAIKIYNEKY